MEAVDPTAAVEAQECTFAWDIARDWGRISEVVARLSSMLRIKSISSSSTASSACTHSDDIAQQPLRILLLHLRTPVVEAEADSGTAEAEGGVAEVHTAALVAAGSAAAQSEEGEAAVDSVEVPGVRTSNSLACLRTPVALDEAEGSSHHLLVSCRIRADPGCTRRGGWIEDMTVRDSGREEDAVLAAVTCWR